MRQIFCLLWLSVISLQAHADRFIDPDSEYGGKPSGILSLLLVVGIVAFAIHLYRKPSHNSIKDSSSPKTGMMSLKKTTILRIVGVVVLFINLGMIGAFKMVGIPVLILTFGFAVVYEKWAVRRESTRNAAGIICISLVLVVVTPIGLRAIHAATDRGAQEVAKPAETRGGNDKPEATFSYEEATQPADWEKGRIAPPVATVNATQTSEVDRLMANAPPYDEKAATAEHYRRIYAAHPDADAIYESANFKHWLAKYPAYQRITVKGSAQEIIEMFTAYKNEQ